MNDGFITILSFTNNKRNLFLKKWTEILNNEKGHNA